jgi:hypothetical protein
MDNRKSASMEKAAIVFNVFIFYEPLRCDISDRWLFAGMQSVKGQLNPLNTFIRRVPGAGAY